MILIRSRHLVVLVLWLSYLAPCEGQQIEASVGDAMLAAYFQSETSKLAEGCLDDDAAVQAWIAKRSTYRNQLLEMLGLDPLPRKTDLKVEITKRVEHEDIVVQCLHFQSRPGLYVTANLYMPREINEPLPAILYVCGHGRVRIDGVDYGNKVNYQHHPAWFAQNGYVCLTIDTLQLGEIEGIHHGTYREGMWWWLNRGYTPAGVEAWNCVRSIDLLQSLDEVDGERIGVTGRSGGGVYSWWITAIDDRIKCAVPVAGITDLENHVVDGCVEGHCDCMYMVNTYRWDYPMLAALAAPRPLLISNTDSDRIFPLDGVYRTYQKVKRVYAALDAEENVAFHITAGPHKDTQELRVHAFRWMNRHLKGDTDSPVQPAEKLFDPVQLKVFDALPTNPSNTQVHEHFVELAEPGLPPNRKDWYKQRDAWLQVLKQKVFRGWPENSDLNASDAFEKSNDDLVLRAIDFDSQPHVRLRLLLASCEDGRAKHGVELQILDNTDWQTLSQTLDAGFRTRLVDVSDSNPDNAFVTWAAKLRASGTVLAYLAPRGIGPTAWDSSERKQIQNRRRFYLLGQTRDGMQTYDVTRAIELLSQNESTSSLPVTVMGDGVMAGIGLYASLFAPKVAQLKLSNLPSTHRHGPIFLNVRRFFDLPQALAMAVTSKRVQLSGTPSAHQYAEHVAALIGRSEALHVAH